MTEPRFPSKGADMTLPVSRTHAMDSQRIEAYVDAAAAVLDLPLAPEHRPGVLAYFALAAGLAESVLAMPLGSADDPAPVFTPIGPDEAQTPGVAQPR